MFLKTAMATICRLLLTLCIAALWQGAAHANEPFVPNFWDPKKRLERPQTGAIRVIRFLTDDDYPPFNFTAPDGQLTGFNVELARLICEELQIACTVQARRWDTLIDSLTVQRNGDAIIASLAKSPANQARLDFTQSYYRTPARFLARKGDSPDETTPDRLKGKSVGVVANSAHAAFIKDLFPAMQRVDFVELAEARKALADKRIDTLFADGFSLAIWLNGSESRDCCQFIGGPYLESRYFGEGVGIAVRKEPDAVLLRQALDYALAKIARDGRYSALYLKYFPVSPF
jgi:polar amino acid transport system substrate-binding protein